MSLRTVALLVLGVVAVSFSAPLVRLTAAPALTIALYRTAFATGLLAPVAVRRHRAELRGLTRRDLALLVGAGAVLALHFATWISSLSFTTVAASAVLVTMQVVFVAAGGWVFFRERISRSGAAGIALALAGSIVISGGDFGVSGRAFFGDLLALAGAVFAAGYLLAGRVLRQRFSLLAYAVMVYGSCAVLLVPAILVGGLELTGFPLVTWFYFLCIAVGPQILGHTTFNFLLRDVDATVVAVAIMGEPIGASLLALALFGEVPPLTAIVGGVLVLIGIYVAITAQARRVIAAPVE